MSWVNRREVEKVEGGGKNMIQSYQIKIIINLLKFVYYKTNPSLYFALSISKCSKLIAR